MELTQIGGVDEANRVNEAVLGPGSVLLVTERVMTEGNQRAVSRNSLVLEGDDSRANLVSRSVIKDDSVQDFFATLEARARCFGHIECDSILIGNGRN
jgi:Fe-S cluster assembly scaffold protein SufB